MKNRVWMRVMVPLVLSIVVFTLAGCTWMGTNVSYFSDDEKISIPSGTYKTLVIENKAGTIRIVSSSDDRITGTLSKKASGSGVATLKEVVTAVTYQVDAMEGVLRLTEVFRTDDRIDFWSWKDDNHPDVSVGLEYELAVPPDVNVVEIRQTAGNTSVEDFKGSIVIASNAGNVTMENVWLVGDSRIALVSGNLDMEIDLLDPAGSLTAELTAGNITLELPKDLDCDLDAGVEAGTISGNFDPLPITNSTIRQSMGAGGSGVSVRVESGNIRILNGN